ncbi:MAG TPA: hypothetical protein V6D20_12290 [Candidatus Obscuribacterales bacterium]
MYVTLFNIADGPGSATIDTTATLWALPGLVDLTPTHPHNEKLANEIAAMSLGPSMLAVAGISLSLYDESVGNANPNLTLVVSGTTSGNDYINTVFDDPTDAPVSTFQAFEGETELDFAASGQGQASVVVGLSFTPASFATVPEYRGIFVEKTIRAFDSLTSSAYGPILEAVVPGNLYQVTVQVARMPLTSRSQLPTVSPW